MRNITRIILPYTSECHIKACIFSRTTWLNIRNDSKTDAMHNVIMTRKIQSKKKSEEKISPDNNTYNNDSLFLSATLWHTLIGEWEATQLEERTNIKQRKHWLSQIEFMIHVSFCLFVSCMISFLLIHNYGLHLAEREREKRVYWLLYIHKFHRCIFFSLVFDFDYFFLFYLSLYLYQLVLSLWNGNCLFYYTF